MRQFWPVLLLAVTSLSLQAHELQSVALQLDELASGHVQLTLKTPLSRDGEPVAVMPHFRTGCSPQGEARVERLPGQILRQWRLHCAAGLAGRQLVIEGLNPRIPDAVVTLRFADGQQLTTVLDRHDPQWQVQRPVDATATPGLLAYIPIGITHILLGPDHLLFVLGLMLVVHLSGRRTRSLVLALTAFTVAHSLTLALATLGIWGLPAKPVELLIALSIALLAWELAVHSRRQAQGLGPSLVMRRPGLVAFVFGLLHGFGFAGALAQLGLPEQARGWALFLFNIGVEIGQLVFVGGLLAMLAVMRHWQRPIPAAGTANLAATLLGGLGTYWVLDRGMAWLQALWWGA